MRRWVAIFAAIIAAGAALLFGGDMRNSMSQSHRINAIDNRLGGAIGLMTARLAQLHGAASVTVREANPARIDRARTLNFDAGPPSDADAETAHVVFECAGAAAA